MVAGISSNAIAAGVYVLVFFFVYAKELWFWKFKHLIFYVCWTALTLGSYVAVVMYPRKTPETKSTTFCYICRDGRPHGGIHCPICKVCVGNFSEHSRILGRCIRNDQRHVYVMFNCFLYVLNVTLGLFQWNYIIESMRAEPSQKSARLGILIASIGCMSGLAICFPPRLYKLLIGKSLCLFVCLWAIVASYTKVSVLSYFLASVSIGLIPFHTATAFPMLKEIAALITYQYKMLSK